MNWYLEVLRNKYARFDGRAHREEFWMFVLFNVIVAIGVDILSWLLHFHLLRILYVLAVMVPSWAVGARRLHDTNKSGWWQLIGLVPLVGLIVLIVFWVQDSDAGDNRFGPNPRAVVSAPSPASV